MDPSHHARTILVAIKSGDNNMPSLGGTPRGTWNFDPSRKEMTLVPNRPEDADEWNVHDMGI